MEKLKAKISKIENNRKAWRKGVAFVMLFFASIVFGIGAAFAYLSATGGLVTNTFAAEEKFTLTYHGNGQGVTNVPLEQVKYIVGEFEISDTIPVYSGYEFIG